MRPTLGQPHLTTPCTSIAQGAILDVGHAGNYGIKFTTHRSQRGLLTSAPDVTPVRTCMPPQPLSLGLDCPWPEYK